MNQQKKFKLVNDYSKIAEYKVNTQDQLLSYILTINKWHLEFKNTILTFLKSTLF